MIAALGALLCAVVAVAVSGAPPTGEVFGPHDPQQVHTATTSDDLQRAVSWTTFSETPDSIVQWGTDPNALTRATVGRSFAFVDGGSLRHTIFIHNAVFGAPEAGEPLTPDTRYFYRVGAASLGAWSAVFNFTTFAAPYPLLDVLMYGDFGVVNDQSQVALVAEIAKHTPQQLIVHIGDFAYNMDDDNGTRGDVFLNQIQPLAAYVPYMTCVGNHETKYNFSHYTNRFSLIADTTASANNWWYSWDMSYIHFVALSTEVYYLQPWANSAIVAQYEWLSADLSRVDRSKTPWVVVYGHRPLYCSNVDDLPDCSTDAALLRDGTVINGVNYGLDDLLYRYGVDVYFTAHEHSYERTYPVWKYQVDLPADPNVYIDAKYPTHIVTGAAGCQELLDYFSNVTWGNWSAVRSSTYGYGHLRVANATHLHWTQLLAEGADGQHDDLWLVKSNAASELIGDRPARGLWNVGRDDEEMRAAVQAATVDDRDRNEQTAAGPCDRYCFGVCKRYHPLAECATKCRCTRHIDASDGLQRLAHECEFDVSVAKSIRH